MVVDKPSGQGGAQGDQFTGDAAVVGVASPRAKLVQVILEKLPGLTGGADKKAKAQEQRTRKKWKIRQ